MFSLHGLKFINFENYLP